MLGQLTSSLTDGLLLGFVYGLAAMGLSLIWGVMSVINLAKLEQERKLSLKYQTEDTEGETNVNTKI